MDTRNRNDKIMTHIEKVKHIRNTTFSPVNKINEALAESNGDVDAAIQILVNNKQANVEEMNNRIANANIVYSYVHNGRIGAMIVLACQTDFVAKNEAFLNLAKNICMHIVSSPTYPHYIKFEDIPVEKLEEIQNDVYWNNKNKPADILTKIVNGKTTKYRDEVCLLYQKFVRDETVTIGQLINDVSATLGEKIEVKKFTKMVAQSTTH